VGDLTTPEGDGQQGPGRTDDPMSADRRVLAVAAVSMVALVLVGVVSAQLFTRSACDRVAPELIDARTVGIAGPALLDEGITDVDLVLDEAFPALDDAGRDGLFAALAVLEDELGPLVAAADVRGAEGLATVAGEVAALGAVTTLLDVGGTDVRATADLDEGTVVGSGDAVYSLALVNPMTDQVDAVQPLDADLTASPCLDTATVGTPLAFHLDAGDGELLLLRTEEDGDEPALELRDAATGSIWSTPVDVGIAPAGVLAERVTARLGGDTLVVGWRTLDDHEGDAVAALDRATGEVRWTAPVTPLREAAGAEGRPLWIRVLAVAGDEVLVSLVPEDASGSASTATVALLDLADGEVRWTQDAEGEPPVLAVPIAAGWATAAAGEGLEVTELDGATGELRGRSVGPAGGEPRGAQLPDGGLVVTAGALLVVDGDATREDGDARRIHTVVSALRFTDIEVVEDRVHVLLTDEEDGAALLTFTRPDREG
jgi:outer membrane protein assembly factor BamB